MDSQATFFENRKSPEFFIYLFIFFLFKGRLSGSDRVKYSSSQSKQTNKQTQKQKQTVLFATYVERRFKRE